ncbi:DUF4253 domain-containing protein [Streptomyces caeni]|uniref:DUF4253 domain-containing protein n=1 Tax=Streptomyces caeni TaxID=2307231 RepID=A0ABW4IK17_9ACTN
MASLPNPLPRLAADPSGRALGLELPPGRLIDATIDGPWREPLLWHAGRAASSGNWARLGARAARAGLLPVLVEVGGKVAGPDKWELAPREMSYPGDHDAGEVLNGFWDDYVAEAGGVDGGRPGREKEKAVEVFGGPASLQETLAPFGPDWPGLAPGRALAADPDVRAAEVADRLLGDGSWFEDPRLALVPARRSADIPAVIGWPGPLNYENDTGVLCSVLRSWEDRFGIRVVALTFDQLVLSVAAPPTTRAEAEVLAAEHFACCPDNIVQGHHETLRAYAEHAVLDQRVWSFWWD